MNVPKGARNNKPRNKPQLPYTYRTEMLMLPDKAVITPRNYGNLSHLIIGRPWRCIKKCNERVHPVQLHGNALT